MKTNTIFLISIFLVSLFLGFFGVAWIASMGVILAMVLVYIYVVLSPVIFTRNMQKTEQFLLKHQQNASYFFLYSLINNNDEASDQALEKLLKKRHSSQKEALFITMHALNKKDVGTAWEYVDKLSQQKLRDYYKGVLYIEEGRLDKAKELANNVKKKWMRHSLHADIYEREGKKDAAKEHADQAIAVTRGLQRYSLVRHFERL